MPAVLDIGDNVARSIALCCHHSPTYEKKNMQNTHAYTIATKLNEATRAGDLAGAYRIVGTLSTDDAHAVLLAAGHSCCNPSNSQFRQLMQRDIAAACRMKVDGFGYTSTRSNNH